MAPVNLNPGYRVIMFLTPKMNNNLHLANDNRD